MLGPRNKVDPEGSTACELVNLVVDEVGKSDNLWHMGRLEVQAVEALLHQPLELLEVVDGRGGEHREHLLGKDSVVVDVVAEIDGRDVELKHLSLIYRCSS